MTTQKIDPKVIFASDAPAIDKPPVFSDKTKGWDVARANDGRPQIKEMNKIQQDTDLKILWLNENAVLPYDATIDYPDGAVTLKDGSFKQISSGSWIEFLDDFADKDAVKRGIANRYDSSLAYNSGERVVLTNGYIVKSTVDGNTNDPNVDMTGWVYSSLTPSNNLSDVENKAEARTNLDVYSKDEVNTAITTSVPIVADATTIDKGIVRLATEGDITNSSETAVVTPKHVADMLVGIGSLAKGFCALFSARLTQMTGTNTSNDKTITCNITAHGLSVGDVVSVNYQYKGLGIDQRVTDTVVVTSVANVNTFTFTSPRNASGSASAVACTLYYVIKNNYNVNSLTINSEGRYTISINTASGITGTSFIPFIQATTTDNSLVIVQPEAITSPTSLTVRTFDASGAAITPQWLHIGVTQ